MKLQCDTCSSECFLLNHMIVILRQILGILIFSIKICLASINGTCRISKLHDLQMNILLQCWYIQTMLWISKKSTANTVNTAQRSLLPKIQCNAVKSLYTGVGVKVKESRNWSNYSWKLDQHRLFIDFTLTTPVAGWI